MLERDLPHEALHAEVSTFDAFASSNDMEALIMLHPASAPASVVEDTPELPATGPITVTPVTTPPTPAGPLEADGWGIPVPTNADSDPPLLTDGRGRVVWSTTPASRRGRGRAASSTLPATQSHKSRLREDTEVQDPVGPSHSRSPRLARTRSFPETSSDIVSSCSLSVHGSPSNTTSPLLLFDGLN